MDIIKNACEKLTVVKGEAGESVHQVAGSVKKETLDFCHLLVCQALDEGNVDPLKTLLLGKFLC
jgi:hypothetical protein